VPEDTGGESTMAAVPLAASGRRAANGSRGGVGAASRKARFTLGHLTEW
jgi:hypothetical protein